MKKFKTKKYLLSGRQIPSDFYYYINEVSDTSAVKYRFELKNEEKCYLIEYEIEEGIITLPLYMVAFFDI